MIPRPAEYANWKDWASKVLEVLTKADVFFKKQLKTQIELPLTITGVVLGGVAPEWEYDERNGRFSVRVDFVAPGVDTIISIDGLDLSGKTKLTSVAGVGTATAPAIAFRRCRYNVTAKTIEIYALAGDTRISALLIL